MGLLFNNNNLKKSPNSDIEREVQAPLIYVQSALPTDKKSAIFQKFPNFRIFWNFALEDFCPIKKSSAS